LDDVQHQLLALLFLDYPMDPETELWRRRHPRYPAALRLSAQETPSVGMPEATKIAARIQDISVGGLRFSCEKPCKPSSLLRCEIFFPGYSVPIPTLAHIRWIREASGNEFVVGVQFLL